jgi:hypothetical protein
VCMYMEKCGPYMYPRRTVQIYIHTYRYIHTYIHTHRCLLSGGALLPETSDNDGKNQYIHIYAHTHTHRCLLSGGALLPETSDNDGRNRFLRFSPFMYFADRRKKYRIGLKCCTINSISLHYLEPLEVYWLYGKKYQECESVKAMLTK